MRLARRSLVGFAGAGIVALLAPPALAHRSQSVLTTIEWSPAQKSLQVIHRFHTTDAELALAKSAGGAAVDLTQLKDQARLIVYVEAHFTLYDGKKPIALEPIGVELSGDEAVVYREAKRTAPSKELGIDDRLLREAFDQQTNLVNVKMTEGRVRTLIFAGRDGRKDARDLL